MKVNPNSRIRNPTQIRSPKSQTSACGASSIRNFPFAIFHWKLPLLLAFGLLPSAFCLAAAPLGTAFTYQGRLTDGGMPANGIYDLRFTIYDALTNGGTGGTVVTNAATPVAGGLFTVTLDFGAGVFTNAPRWLEISMRTNGDWFPLSPRQPLTPAPYALYAPSAGAAGTATTAARANGVAATNISGTLSLAQLPAATLTNNQTGVTLGGTFSGNGGGISNINLLSVNSRGAFAGTRYWGNFTTASTPPVGSAPHWITAADVNGDGMVDLVSSIVAAPLGTAFTYPGLVQAPGAPTLYITNAGPGWTTIWWTPPTPGFTLQSSPAVVPTVWTNAPSGTNNPALVPATLPANFYRLHRP